MTPSLPFRATVAVLLFWGHGPTMAFATALDTCEQDQDCYHGGECKAVDGTGSKNCVCQEQYSGLRCERFCPLPCANGGRCMERKEDSLHYLEDFPEGMEDMDKNLTPYLNDYMCHCKGLFTGHLCNIPYTNCGDMTRCYFGGECRKDTENEPCKCPGGYSGSFCEAVVSWDDDDDLPEVLGVPTLPDVPVSETADADKIEIWKIIMGSLAAGTLLGVAAFVLYERRRQRRATWLVSSHTSDSSMVEKPQKTFVNVI